MKVTQVWEIESIEWVDPTAPAFRDDIEALGLGEPLGLTPNQMSHKAGSNFQVLRFIPPALFLDIVDPLFDPSEHGKKTLSYFDAALSQGKPFAPLQVWLGFWEYAYWPYPDRALDYQERAPRIKAERGQPVTHEERLRMVRTHEGRHRAWFARELGETEVPVTVWVHEEDR